MRKKLILALLLVLALFVLGVWAWTRSMGGIDPAAIAPATVSFDRDGVPTIRARTWGELAKAQGYVVASERLFQMDLMRHAASGRLAEWIGPAVLRLDEMRRREGWQGLAERGYAELTPVEKELVDRYTEGVNAFIEGRRSRWGLEYLAFGKPEPWKGSDSLLVLLSMLDQLTRAADSEAWRTRWSEGLGPKWSEFLFTQNHPWNVPLFGDPQPGPELPWDAKLEREPLQPGELKSAGLVLEEPASVGSNNWVWCKAQKCLVANDPHLGLSVPGLWYAVRLVLEGAPEGDVRWVVGVTIPGLPGVTLGMSSHLAWAFTNVGEDVDDWLRERVSEDGKQYLASIRADGSEEWRAIESSDEVIRIRGAPEVTVKALRTHRGPLVEPTHPARRPGGPFAMLGTEHYYSRQWLGSQPHMIHLPVELNRAGSIEAMMTALDAMTLPAQNVLMADRSGRLAYRASGTTVIRRVSGQLIQDAVLGEWVGVLGPERRRRLIVETSSASHFLATANERIWVDEYGHRWGDDARKDRIRTVLSSKEDFGVKDMRALQRDTHSRFHQELLSWVLTHGSVPEARASRWRAWTGAAVDDAVTFTEAVELEDKLSALLIERVRRKRMPPGSKDWPFPGRLTRAWILATLAAPNGMELFGLEVGEVARFLGQLPVPSETYTSANRWQAQHPFVGRIPVVGSLFAVPEVDQVGFDELVRSESPKFGASVRLIWSPSNPRESEWSVPVGQSGHVASPHYSDGMGDWFAGRYRRALPEPLP
ncbi:MAG: penicillin acylase family protein [Deltaproteobacteria bacterium]|nr:penicillin acylase family protein [Deltaproteobacteria bacterium]